MLMPRKELSQKVPHRRIQWTACVCELEHSPMLCVVAMRSVCIYDDENTWQSDHARRKQIRRQESLRCVGCRVINEPIGLG